ncbi:MAG: hypothetical protein ACREB3_08895, partial [Burkholderiales bacterium]
PSKESKCHWVVPGAAPAVLRSLLGLQPQLQSDAQQSFAPGATRVVGLMQSFPSPYEAFCGMVLRAKIQ